MHGWLPEPRFSLVMTAISEWALRGRKPILLLESGRYIPCIDFHFTVQPRWVLFENLSGLLVRGDTLVEQRPLALMPAQLVDLDHAVDRLYADCFQIERTTNAYHELKRRIAAARECLSDAEDMEKIVVQALGWELHGPETFAGLKVAHETCWGHLNGLRVRPVPPLSLAYPGLQQTWAYYRDDNLDLIKKVRDQWAMKLLQPWLLEVMNRTFPAAGILTGRQHSTRPANLLAEWLVSCLRSDMAAKVIPNVERARLVMQLGDACRYMHVEQHYELDLLPEIAAVCDLAKQREALLRAMVHAMRQNLVHPEAQGLLTTLAPEEIRQDPQVWKLFKELFELIRCGPRDEDRWALRQELLRCLFVYHIMEVGEDFADRLCRMPFVDVKLFIDYTIKTVIESAGSDRDVVIQRLRRLEDAAKTWEAIDKELCDGTWRKAGLVSWVSGVTNNWVKEHLRLEVAALESLSDVYGSISAAGADMEIVCGEYRIPVHRAYLARFGRDCGSFWRFLMDRPQREILLPANMPCFTRVTAACLVSFIYTGSIPVCVAEEYKDKLQDAFAYLCGHEGPLPLAAIPAPRAASWFDDEMQKLADMKFQCTDGTFPFYSAIQRSFAGELKSTEDLVRYGLNIADLEWLLRIALGDAKGITYDADSYHRFMRLDRIAAWLIGPDSWEKWRVYLAYRSMKQLSDVALLQAVADSHANPNTRVVLPAERALELRIVNGPVAATEACLGITHYRASRTILVEKCWTHIVDLLCECPHLRRVDFSNTNVPAHELNRLVRSCREIIELRLRDCPNLHPAVCQLSEGRVPEELPCRLDDLTVFLICTKFGGDPLLDSAHQVLQAQRGAQLSIESIEQMAAATKAPICRLDLRENRNVDGDFLKRLVAACPELEELLVDDDEALHGALIKELPKLPRLRGLSTHVQVVRLLQTELPNLKRLD